MTPSIRTASAVSPSRYVGKTCSKHPDLGGLRLVRNYVCVGCARDAKTKARTSSDPARLRTFKVQRVAEIIAARHGGGVDSWAAYADVAAEVYDYVSRGTQPAL